jgi:hypothetical protein
MQTKHKIINGDSRRMSEIKVKSVHLIFNAHLLKERLAEVDNGFDFKYKRKFETL